MHPNDKEKTAFKTDSDNFYYEVMSFDLKNVRATYQRLMDNVFQGMIGRSVEFCVDDIRRQVQLIRTTRSGSARSVSSTTLLLNMPQS